MLSVLRRRLRDPLARIKPPHTPPHQPTKPTTHTNTPSKHIKQHNQFCHGVLWPLFHCINTNFFNEGLLESFMEQYEAYAHANQCYLEVRFVPLWSVRCLLPFPLPLPFSRVIQPECRGMRRPSRVPSTKTGRPRSPHHTHTLTPTPPNPPQKPNKRERHTLTLPPHPPPPKHLKKKQVVADTYEQGDLVLVLDYELMLLPMLLRKRFPDIVCGFFLHCPFPSSEFYRMLPVRQQLLQVGVSCILYFICIYQKKGVFLGGGGLPLSCPVLPARCSFEGASAVCGSGSEMMHTRDSNSIAVSAASSRGASSPANPHNDPPTHQPIQTNNQHRAFWAPT